MNDAIAIPRFAVAVLCVLVLTGCLYGRHMRRGDMYRQNRSYPNAIVEYKAALARRPGSSEARRKLKQTEKVYFGQLHGEVDERLAVGDYEAALEGANSAYNVNPDDPSVRELVERVAEETMARAGALEEARHYGRADWLLELASGSLPPAAEAMTQRRGEVRKAWVEWAAASAQAHESDGHRAAAALYWALAAEVSKESQYVRRAKQLAARVRSDHGLTVAITGRRRNAETRSIVQRIAGPPGVMAATFLTAETPQAYRARVRAEPTRFDTQTSTRVESVQYVSGTRTRPNPRYQELTDDLRHARHRLHVIEDDARSARRKYDYTGSEYDRQRYNDLVGQFNQQERYVTQLRNELGRTPMEYEEEVYSTHDYRVESRTRTATLDLGVRIVSPDGEIVAETLQSPVASATDESHRAQPVAGIAEDPMELPSDGALRERLYDDGAEVVVAVVQEAFEAHRRQVLAESRQDSGALEAAATYVLLQPWSASASVVADLRARSGVEKPDRILATAI